MSGVKKHSLRPRQAPFYRLGGKRREHVDVIINKQYFCVHVCELDSEASSVPEGKVDT